MLKVLLTVFAVFFFCAHVDSQLISKKESKAISALLANLSASHQPGKYLIRNVSILTMRSSEIAAPQDILVSEGIIQEIGVNIPHADATVIDGTGKYVMPGLTNMHLHLFNNHQMRETWILQLLLYGVTSVRDMCGEPPKLSLRESIRANSVLGPNLYQAGPVIDGQNDQFNLFAKAASPGEARGLVKSQKRAGYDLIKVYDGLSNEVFNAIVEAAKEAGIAVSGHVPASVSLIEALDAGINCIEYLMGYFKWKGKEVSITAPANYGVLTANSTTWNCPTLYSISINWSVDAVNNLFQDAERIPLPSSLVKNWQKRVQSPPQDVVAALDQYGQRNIEKLQHIVKTLYESGAKLVAGTDAGNLPLLIPGYSLHQELRTMHELGIPVYDVLKMTTISAATALGKESEYGTIQEGQRADLLMLEKNPLESLKHLTSKAGLMIRGIWLSQEDLVMIDSELGAVFGKSALR